MKLLNWIIKGLDTISSFFLATLGIGFLLMALSGMITFGCSKSFWINQMTCTMTMVLNGFK